MTRRHQRQHQAALREKETTVPTLTDTSTYADLLAEVPALSTCTRGVLEEFVAHGVDKLHCAAGRSIGTRTSTDQNLYVLVGGSASFRTGDDIRVALEPGDYFGNVNAHSRDMTATVVAEQDIEILVIRPQQLTRLAHASSRDRHPSQIDWRSDFSSTPTTPTVPPAPHRSPAMAS
jgi:hypothetical protein